MNSLRSNCFVLCLTLYSYHNRNSQNNEVEEERRKERTKYSIVTMMTCEFQLVSRYSKPSESRGFIPHP